MLKTFKQYIAEDLQPDETRRLKGLGVLEPEYHLTFNWGRREGGDRAEIEADYNLSTHIDGDEITLTGTRANIEDFVADYGVIHDDWEEGTDGDFYAGY